jgi:hypothetical protein
MYSGQFSGKLKMKQYTHKTRDGKYLARILSTDLDNETCIVVALKDADETGGELIAAYHPTLKIFDCGESGMDLVEISFWESVRVDTKIFVRHSDNEGWTPRYFSHYADGMIYAFVSGATSWSAPKNGDGSFYVYGWDCAKLAE